MDGTGYMLAINELHWTVTHLGSAWVVDTLRGKNSSSMALDSLSVCQAYGPFVPGDSTSGLRDIVSAFGP